MLGGAGLLGVGVVDMLLWAKDVAGWGRVGAVGGLAGCLLAPGALLSRGIVLHHGIAWVQATAITAAASALTMGWVAGMAMGERLGWPRWAVHTGAFLAFVALIVGSVWYGVGLAASTRRR